MAMRRTSSQGIQKQRPAGVLDHAAADATNMKGALLPKNLRAFLELDPEPRLPFGWEKCFDVKTGLIFFKNSSNGIRTSKDPRVHQQGVDSELRPCLAKCLSGAAADQQCDKREGWMPCVESNPLGGAAKFTMEEKLWSWKRTNSSKKLPSLLSLKSNDSLLSLELSLRLEGPQARESSTIQLAGVSEQETRRDWENADRFKVEQLEECVQNFLGTNHNMGPFPSALGKVKEEPNSTPFWDQAPGVCTMEPSTFPKAAPEVAIEYRERVEVPAAIHMEQLKFRDFLGPNYNMGPFSSTAGKVKEESIEEPMPSSREQSAVSCTLEKIQVALKRSQFDCKAATNSVRTQTPTLTSWFTKSTLLSSPLSFRSPLAKLPSRSVSPTTSDASSAASSKSSRHSSTSPSVMSFQGEELDDLGALASSSDASPSSQAFHSSNSKAHSEAAGVLVAVGCTSCLMFFMHSKNNPSCPKCGSIGLLEILPTSSSSQRKRQRMESSNVGTESRRSWDAHGC